MSLFCSSSLPDVIGVVKSTQDLTSITSKTTSKEIKKRDLQLVDEGRVIIRMTLWGTDAESFDGSNNPVLAVKGAKVSEWGGRTLSTLSSSQMVVNPDIPEAYKLRAWFDREGASADFMEFQGGNTDGGAGGSGKHPVTGVYEILKSRQKFSTPVYMTMVF